MTLQRLIGSSLAIALAAAAPTGAQTTAQNDSAVRAVARSSGLPLATPRTTADFDTRISAMARPRTEPPTKAIRDNTIVHSAATSR